MSSLARALTQPGLCPHKRGDPKHRHIQKDNVKRAREERYKSGKETSGETSAALCSWTHSLQSGQKINFCCLRQLAVGGFVK